MTPIRTALALATLAFVFPAAAQEVTRIPHLDGEIVIDGVLDDAAWSQATPVELNYEISPGDNVAPPVRTTMRIASTRDALYLSFHAQDPDPSKIRAHLTDRDGAYRDEFVGVMLDTFDDHRRNYEFFVNPFGVQMDLIREEATGNEDDSWDGLWTSAGRVTADGYDVEIRIPFSTLRFRDTEGAKRWGVIGFRSYPRNVRHQIANVVVPRGGNCLMCQAAKFEGMEGVQQGRNIEVVPTLTMTNAQTRDRADGDWHGDGVQIEPGVDVSWAPSPNLTLNATINPDFSQVESDQAQLDLTTNFALYFPEKRPFFMEGADYFNTPFQVLYTRQIADPDYGLRVTGRTGSGAYGAFVARDAITQLLVPGVLGSGFEILEQPADVLVARYRHDLNASTSIGLVTTARHGDDYRNDVAGVDGRWQHGSHTVVAQLLRSDSQYPLQLGFDDAAPTGNAWRAAYDYETRNWFASTWHEQVDPGFRADLGFIGQVGYDKSLVGGGYNWFFDKGSKINRVQLYTDYDITHRFDGQLLERELEARLQANGPMQSTVGIQGMTRDRFWNGRLFGESYVNLFANATPRSGMQIGGNFRFGPQIDLAASRRGQGRFFDIYGNFSIGLGLSFNVDLFQQSLRRDGGTAFEATVLDTRLAWQLDPRQRLRLTVQASNVDKDPALYAHPVNRHARDVGAQLVYSYKVNPRTAVYAGGALGGFLDDEHRDLFASNRGVFVKLSYGWQP
ncbi:carbohydrate binding family 9 domain-containing protein [Cognatilysobacter segetis]|uniref:carbohydrate binding family 9 domain-containing protein n=1 Tax=Cognatilysobacter segetis TaxID=2492394 RepID=UPI00138FED69|nr:carbohydrate binding family 9 domain-containing protein [Lysobacter segetis]